MKTDNQIISDARGECRHEFEQITMTQNMRFRELECKWCNHRITLKGNELPPIATDYSDPSAWTPELYQWIKSRPICDVFMQELEDEVLLDYPYPKESTDMRFLFMESTPAQKASALAKAIKETPDNA